MSRAETAPMIQVMLAVAVIALGGCSTAPVKAPASLERYSKYFATSVSAVPSDGRLRVTFLGVSTILLDDGETRIMTDGFFSRPDMLTTLLGKLAPDEARIAFALSGGRAVGGSDKKPLVDKLDALMVLHSHYDHALDTANVALRTGARVIGSASTANIARGGGVPEERICVVAPGALIKLGRFRIAVFSAKHSPGRLFRYHGDVEAPLSPPARMSAYNEGETYAYLVEHDGRRIMIHGSAGFQPGMFHDVPADVLFLGIGKLGRKNEAYMEKFWHETVTATGAKQIFLVHWDNFFQSLDQPLEPLQVIDDFDAAMKFLMRQATDEVAIFLPMAFQTVRLVEPSLESKRLFDATRSDDSALRESAQVCPPMAAKQ